MRYVRRLLRLIRNSRDMEQSFGNEMDEFITLDWRRSIDTDKKKSKEKNLSNRIIVESANLNYLNSDVFCAKNI